jgi:predicted Ser/Thr protein kinase
MESSPAPSQALPSGTRIEEFVVERVLGSGGFGITYLARDARLDRQVVIKENLPAQFCFRDTHSLTVAPRHTHGEDADNFQWSLENFSKEAAMLASLDHPGIVKVLRSFEAFGTAYFAMPFVEGMALDELAKKRAGDPFSEAELIGMLERVLRALGYLHDRGIYHRDIKPGNLLITNEGLPVLIDFGSARQRLSERSMTVVESAGYTPFEQMQSNGNIGPWSDLYSLGATLVKVMTGEAPPKAMDRIKNDPYVPLATRAGLLKTYSPGFLANIDKSLAVEDEERWKDAKEWRGDVSREQHGITDTSSTASVMPDANEAAGGSPGPTKKRLSRRALALVACLAMGSLLWKLGAEIQKGRSAKAAVVDQADTGRKQAESIAEEEERERKAEEEGRMAEASRIREEKAGAERERRAALAKEEMERKTQKIEPVEDSPIHQVIPGTFFDMLCKIRGNAILEAEKLYEGSTFEMREGNALVIDRLTKALIQLVAAAYDESQLKGKTPEEFVAAKLFSVFELLEMQMEDEIRDGRNGTLGIVEVGMNKIDAVAEIIEEIVRIRLSPEDFSEWKQKWDAAGEATSDEGPNVVMVAEPVTPDDEERGKEVDPLAFLVERRATQADVEGWSIEGLSFALNYLYARQGYPFRNKGNESLRQAFDRYPWYRPVEGMTDDQAGEKMPLTVKENMEFLAGIRVEFKKRVPIEDPRESLTKDFISHGEATELSLAEIRYSINYLYARHGFPFEGEKSESIRREFERFPWYRPVAGRTMEQIDRMMNPFERQNVQILAEARREK